MTYNNATDTLITLAGKWVASNNFYAGLWINDNETVDATGATTEYDFGAATSNGGKAYLLVHSITGTATSATIDVESSATSGSGHASEGTFTFSAVGVYPLSLSGTVNRYIQANVTDLGGADDITISILVCLADITY